MTTLDSDPSDHDIEDRVKAAFAGLTLPCLKRLEVGVRDGIAFLDGRVPNFYQRQLAIHACQRVAGVREVVDSIEVDL